MKREKLNVLSERDLLIGLITSDKFCREIIPVLNPRHLELDYARILSGWIKDFYENYNYPPQRDVIKLYRSHCEELNDESLQENVLTFIQKIDRDYEDIQNFNVDYAIKQAINYLKTRSLLNLNEDINSYLLTGDVIKAENAITKYKTIEKSSGEAISILNNTEAVENAFLERKEPLFSIPGAYGRVVGKIHREDFIAFLAPPKRGKTWVLMDVAVHAVQAGLKVLYVSLEMSEGDVIKRFWTSLTGENDSDEEVLEVTVPYFEECGENKFKIKEKIIYPKMLDLEGIRENQKDLNRVFRGGDIRVLCEPAYSLTVKQLDVKIERLIQQEGYTPDVIIVDYGDIMAPGVKDEYRNQLDSIWKGLRSMAQSRKCTVFTASQSGRDSATKKDVGVTNVAEDFRKVAHVTSMVSLNQSEVEKKKGILRLKQLVLREGTAEFRQAICTQCLAIGRLITDSHFENEVTNFNSESTPKEGDDIKRSKRI